MYTKDQKFLWKGTAEELMEFQYNPALQVLRSAIKCSSFKGKWLFNDNNTLWNGLSGIIKSVYCRETCILLMLDIKNIEHHYSSTSSSSWTWLQHPDMYSGQLQLLLNNLQMKCRCKGGESCLLWRPSVVCRRSKLAQLLNWTEISLLLLLLIACLVIFAVFCKPLWVESRI